MKKNEVIIQQMYEDIPTTAYTSFPPVKGVRVGENMTCASGDKPSVTQLPQSRATLVPSQTGRPSNLPTPERLAMQKTKSCRINTLSGPHRMTNTTALSTFGDKLTPYEKEEIKAYTEVYCIGLLAKKHGFNVDHIIKKPGDMYDDADHFYRVVPQDHIAYRYELTDRPHLGKGTFGQVVKAYDHKAQRFVALKIVRNEKIYLKQSREELRLLQYLRKQDINGAYNIVAFNEFFIFRNHMVISFELLGINLYQALKKNKYRGLPMIKVRQIAQAVLKCLELLFRNRIIHCDLKPENIMLRKHGDFSNVKVGDFGSSCYEQQQVYHYIQSRYYRAPEVILGLRYGPAIDMWSLGCVLAEMATGQPIFTGLDEYDQLSAVEEVMGEVPSSMVAGHKVKTRPPRSKKRGPPGSIQLESILIGDDQFKAMVRKILEMDPEVRPTPVEIQEHPWLHCKTMIPPIGHDIRDGSRGKTNTRRNTGTSLAALQDNDTSNWTW